MSSKESEHNSNVEQLQREYRASASLAQNFATESTRQIQKLLESNGVTLGFPIQARVKTWESIAEKLERVSLNISSVAEIQDLIGLRLVLLFKRDVSRVHKLLADHFTITKSYDTQERLNEDQFGYSSLHCIIAMPKSWLSVPTLAQMEQLKAEVQIRTIAQHMWAEVSHNLQYKQEDSAPLSVRRSIHRASALLETLDLEFERVLEEREAYRADSDILVTNDKLNVDSLERALNSLLPRENKKGNEPYADLLRDLLTFEVDTPSKLRNLIGSHLPRILDEDNKQVVMLREEQDEDMLELMGATSERLSAGVFYAHVGLVRKAMEEEFGEQWEEYERNPKS